MIRIGVRTHVQVQVAGRIGWMESAHALPSFELYPPQT